MVITTTRQKLLLDLVTHHVWSGHTLHCKAVSRFFRTVQGTWALYSRACRNVRYTHCQVNNSFQRLSYFPKSAGQPPQDHCLYLTRQLLIWQTVGLKPNPGWIATAAVSPLQQASRQVTTTTTTKLGQGLMPGRPAHYDSHLALVGVGWRWFSVGAGQCGVGHQRRCDGTPCSI